MLRSVSRIIFLHLHENRNGGTFGMALFAWEAYNKGKTVYCNCQETVDGRVVHILNFPHEHYRFDELRQMELFNCYLMADEALEFLDAFDAPKKAMREISYFTGQAKKRGVDLHLDTIRIKNIYNRVRLNVDGWIETFRYPRNILLPVQAIRFEVTPRYGRVRKFTIAQPMLGRLLKIYNHLAQVTPPGN